MPELQTRPPTGQVAYPLILVEHEEKAGGSYALAQFAASPRVGRTFILDTGDGTADEYASLGPYELLVHDGTWPSMIGQIEAATQAPRVDGKPNVVGIDHGSAIWQMLKVWTDNRARNSAKAKAILAQDPDAEIDAPMNLWNDSKGRWGRMIHLLKTFDGIGVLLAHGLDVTKVEGGVPTRDTVWTIEAEKTTQGTVSAIVRIRRPHQSRLMGVRSLHASDVPAAGLELPDQGMLDHVVFDILGAGGFAASSAVAADAGTPTAQAKVKVLERVAAAYPDSLTDTEVAAEAARLWAAYGLPPKGVEEVSSDRVTALLVDIADGKTQEPVEVCGHVLVGGAVCWLPPGHPMPHGVPPQEPGMTPPVSPGGPPPPPPYPSATEAAKDLERTKGQSLVELARTVGVSPSGPVADVRARIFEAWGYTYKPEPLEEVIDVPEGWPEGKCFCGAPMTWNPANPDDPTMHLVAELDDDHPAQEAQDDPSEGY